MNDEHGKPASRETPTVPETDVRSPVKVGDVIADKYRLDARLGEGGMGQVFKAEHLLLHVPVAVKILHPFLDGRAERRFQREARAAVVLNHPNAVRVLDFGHHEHIPFIVMEYIRGTSLEEWLWNHEDLTIDDVAGIALQLLAALEVAHNLGIVHRDLKPENVLIAPGPEGRVIAKIVDFGLAHVEDPSDAGPTLTKRDAIAGTPAYMSPEQCRSLVVGPSADLYSVGCLLTTMLQGDPPFDGASAMDVIAKQMFLPPPPLKPREGLVVPPLLEKLRMDLLAKQPHARPRDATDAAARLREAVSAEAHEKRLPSRKGEVAQGDREARALPLGDSPTLDTGLSASPTPSLTVRVLTLAERPGGWSEEHVAGLAAQSILVGDVACDVTVIDAGDEVDEAVEALRSTHGPAVVCVEKAAGESLNRLIEAGASDVLRYPIAVDKLAKRIVRVARRRDKRER